ncbi:MAG: NACHT domain-containing NTPase [Desulfococcaceae bacterium]
MGNFFVRFIRRMLDQDHPDRDVKISQIPSAENRSAEERTIERHIEQTGIECAGNAAYAKDQGRAYQVTNSQIGIIGDNASVTYYDRTDPKALRMQYLTELGNEADHLPWSSVDPDYADPGRGESVRLADIYTALDTAELERPKTEDEVRKHLRYEQTEAKRISAQDIISRESRLVLLGDPGSGKSTFVNYLTYVMAQAGISENPDAWLSRLKKAGEWKHGLLLPVRIILREFAATLDKRAQPKADLLLSFLENTARPKEFWNLLYEGLISGKTMYLILLDGLDEVPSDLRGTVVKTINSFAEKYKEHRYLATCRIYAYIGHDYQLQGFRQATLMPFSREQTENFVSAWYGELQKRGRFSEKEAGERAERLKYDATERRDLAGLAERPLLLTVMALLQTFRGQLPDDRVELYQWTVDLLMRRWESRIAGEKGIIEILNIPDLRMTDLEAGLYDVAYNAHAGYGEEDTADIREADLRQRLAPYLNDDWNKAGDFVCYVRERTGLLIRRKPDSYTFPHRTFQEFMAACHLTGMDDYPGESAGLIQEDRDKWRIVFILAAGHAARTHRLSQAVAAVNALCPDSVADSEKPDKEAFQRSVIAGEALLEIGLVGVKRDRAGKAVLERIRNWLVSAVQTEDVLNAKERTEAGNVLLKLGDPRFDPEMFYLPKDKDLG